MAPTNVTSADSADLNKAFLDGELEVAREALLQRLTVAHALLSAENSLSPELLLPDGALHLEILDALLGELAKSRRPEHAWLIYIALSTVMPTMADVEALVRHSALQSVIETRMWLMGFTLHITRSRGKLSQHMSVVDRGVLIDVNFSATDEHNTGIQRVVRRTIPEWERNHSVTLAAWSVGGMRTITQREHHRVLSWDAKREGEHDRSETQLVIPWRSRVVLSEVPARAYMCDPIAAMAILGQYRFRDRV